MDRSGVRFILFLRRQQSLLDSMRKEDGVMGWCLIVFVLCVSNFFIGKA